jgi:hypothetical protein
MRLYLYMANAQGKGGGRAPVPSKTYFGSIIVNPEIIGILGESLLNGRDGTRNVRLGHEGDTNALRRTRAASHG